MRAIQFALLAVSLCSGLIFTGCCSVPVGSQCGCGIGAMNVSSCSSGCDSGSCSSGCDDASCACPGLLHGQIAQRLKSALCGCCNGCGDFYIDEQINEPRVCDPCAGNGEFTGSNCGPCRPLWQRISSLWGRPYHGNCGCGPCGPSCLTDHYAAPMSDGYCSNCRDGVAGQPIQSSHAPMVEATGESMATPAESHSSQVAPPSNRPTPAKKPSLEPVPDPLSHRGQSKSTAVSKPTVRASAIRTSDSDNEGAILIR